MSHDARQPEIGAESSKDSEWTLLRLITQPTRAALLSDVLGHPKELPSIREFEHLNPDVKRSNIEYHLQQLIEAGIIEKFSLPRGQRKRDFPSTFYGLTDNGYALLETHGLLEEQPVWKAVNQRVEKPPEIRQAEKMDRPARK